MDCVCFFTKRLLCWTSIAVYVSLSLDPKKKKVTCGLAGPS